MDKKSLSKRDICTKIIVPALQGSVWDIRRLVRKELTFAKGRVIVCGEVTDSLSLCDPLAARIAAARAIHAQLAQALVEVAVA